MNTAPKLTVMSDTRFMPAAATPAIEVLSAEKIYSNGTRVRASFTFMRKQRRPGSQPLI